MRVIAGKFKGKRLFSPDQSAPVRPTTDRIKETMFNILYSRGAEGGIEALDLFGGSGALGIEALSRGAKKVVFIDSDPAVVKLIRKNLAFVGADKSSYEIYTADYQLAIRKLAGRKFDLILADPPYAMRAEERLLRLIEDAGILGKGGTIVIEHAAENRFDCGNADCDRRMCGNTALSFISYPKEAANG